MAICGERLKSKKHAWPQVHATYTLVTTIRYRCSAKQLCCWCLLAACLLTYQAPVTELSSLRSRQSTFMVGEVTAPDSRQTPSELRSRPLRPRRRRLAPRRRDVTCRLIGTQRDALAVLCVVAVPTKTTAAGPCLDSAKLTRTIRGKAAARSTCRQRKPSNTGST